MLTTEQITLRRTGITASEVSAILGLNPFAGPFDVYLSKTGASAAESETEAMRWGRQLEPVILNRYEVDTGFTLDYPGTVRHAHHPELLGTPDAVVRGMPRGVEAKTGGIHTAHHWGDTSVQAVPPHYLVQCSMYMAICDAECWDLAVLLGGQDYRVYSLDRDPDLEQFLVEAALRFWHEHVVREIPPPIDASASASRFLSTYFARTNGKLLSSTPVTDVWAERLKEARQAVAAARALEAEAENRLKSIIGESDGIEGEFFTLYWRRSKDSTDTDWKALVAELAKDPETFARIESLRPEFEKTRSGSRSFRVYFRR